METSTEYKSREKRSLMRGAWCTADIKLLQGDGLVLTTSTDKTARVWNRGEDSYACAAVLKDHASDVTAASLHATGEYFVTASLDKTWCFYDVATLTCLQQVPSNPLCSTVHALDSTSVCRDKPDKGLLSHVMTATKIKARHDLHNILQAVMAS